MACVGTEGLKGHIRAFHRDQNDVRQVGTTATPNLGDGSAQVSPMPQAPVTNPRPFVRAPDKPEKPILPYIRFSKKVFSSIRAENPELKLFEVGSIIGRTWKKMKAEEKKEYQGRNSIALPRFLPKILLRFQACLKFNF